MPNFLTRLLTLLRFKMAANSDNILNILLSPGTYLDNPECIDYISKLGSLGVDKLIKEPDRLRQEEKQLLEQTQELAFSNYKTFIQTAECSREIFHKFSLTEENLNQVIKGLPELNARCHELSVVSSEVDAHRKLNLLVLSKNNQLLEILELPQLMNNCIKNGHFEEALELSSYVRWLGKKHGNIAIISGIVKEFDKSWQAMLNQLIAQLRTDLQLPKCLQIVGYLRRMEVYSDAELRLKFLQARDTWLQNLLSFVPKTDANQFILKTIELSRIHLFNIITQYRAIFSDEEPVIPSPSNCNINETSIFYSWLNEKICQFVSILDDPELIKNISSLDSIMGQCMYFGQSFSRVGADFRALLAVKFIKIIEQNFEHSVRKVNRKFEQDMDKFVIKKISSVGKIKENLDAKPEQPPMSLVEFYPLADYLNGILTAFNDLRTCAPLAIADFVTKTIQDSLKLCSKVIMSFYRQEQQAFDQEEKEKFTRFCGGFQLLVSYIQKCIHLIFPLQDVANHIGVPIHQIQKDGLTFINESAVLDQLNHLMPVDVISELNLQ